jgi:hypothetical protein
MGHSPRAPPTRAIAVKPNGSPDCRFIQLAAVSAHGVAVRKLIHVNVGFDADGSKIVIYQPDEV